MKCVKSIFSERTEYEPWHLGSDSVRLFTRGRVRLGKRMDDPLCPLCGEEEDTSLHLLGNCCAIAEKRYEFFGRHFLGTGDLRQEHWSILLRFATRSSADADNALDANEAGIRVIRGVPNFRKSIT